MDMENIATWPEKILLKNFKKASIHNGDRFTIFVEVEKRGLVQKFKIKQNTMLFKMINRKPNGVLFWIFLALGCLELFSIPKFFFDQDFIIGWTAILILVLYVLGVQAHRLIITPANVVLKKTVFFLITTSLEKIPIIAHENSGLYYSTTLAFQAFNKYSLVVGVAFTFKQVPWKGKTLTFKIVDSWKSAVNYPLGKCEAPFFKSQITTVLDIIPQNLSRLLSIRRIPFFCEQMPSGEPIFYDDQSRSKEALGSIKYEDFSLKRPLIESPDFKDFCGAFTLPDILTKDAIKFYDANWLRLLFYAQKKCIPPWLSKQSLNQNSRGDYIFSTSTLPLKDKLMVVFGTGGISLVKQNGLIIKSRNYNEVKSPPASSYELVFIVNLPGLPVNLPYDGSLPFKQLIKLDKATT